MIKKPASDHLQRLLTLINSDFSPLATLRSVEESVVWFKNNPEPDLIFLDIQLSDGLSFEIFNYINITCPVIFTTAYEEYAVKAFKVNSIDYLLKPVSKEDLEYALVKFTSLYQNFSNVTNGAFRYKTDQIMKMLSENYKTRFVVNSGMHIKSVEVEKIHLFLSLEKSTFLLESSGRMYDTDYSLEQIESLVDPKLFFRVSRKHLVNINAIADIVSYSAYRLKLKVTGSNDEDILVSRSKMSEFKKWLGK
jgi:DNA-binding LytR/AlgR family response regulator